MSQTLAQTDFVNALQGYLRRLTSGYYPLWVVFAEMLLIGAVIYTILRSLQGTRGARLMRAVGMILLASFLVVRVVAQQFEFDRINFLYPYFLWAVFLITLVVFQPELRRGLLRIGELWGVDSTSKYAEMLIEPLTTAVVGLSRKKIGAIIAVERGVPIGAFVESGVRMDARVTVELLETLFWPGSALHDMGVVIQRGRIAAAGCQFPLADSHDVDRSLGSRHRAALGLSQECDALIIVVSEETGTISISERGQLVRGLSPEEFQARLAQGLRFTAPPPATPLPVEEVAALEPMPPAEESPPAPAADRAAEKPDLVGSRRDD